MPDTKHAPVAVTMDKAGNKSATLTVDGESVTLSLDKSGAHSLLNTGTGSLSVSSGKGQTHGEVAVYATLDDRQRLTAAATVKPPMPNEKGLIPPYLDEARADQQDRIDRELTKEYNAAVASVFKDNFVSETEIRQLKSFRDQVVHAGEAGMTAQEVTQAITKAKTIKGDAPAR